MSLGMKIIARSAVKQLPETLPTIPDDPPPTHRGPFDTFNSLQPAGHNRGTAAPSGTV